MTHLHLAVVIDYNHGAILASDVEMALEALGGPDHEVKAMAVIVSEGLYDELCSKALFAERDREIERLHEKIADTNGQFNAVYELQEHYKALLAERSFPPDEIEALLEHTDALSFPKEWRALRSARARLEKMRDD